MSPFAAPVERTMLRPDESSNDSGPHRLAEIVELMTACCECLAGYEAWAAAASAALVGAYFAFGRTIAAAVIGPWLQAVPVSHGSSIDCALQILACLP